MAMIRHSRDFFFSNSEIIMTSRANSELLGFYSLVVESIPLILSFGVFWCPPLLFDIIIIRVVFINNNAENRPIPKAP